MNLYHKVEAAFDGMADALKAAMNVADNSEETELYSDLSIDIESLRDDAQSLYEKLIQKKNAASAVAAVETAKESEKHSDLSIDRIIENVKTSQLYGCLIVDVAGADKTEPHLYYHTNEELRLLWAGAVEACYHAFAGSGMSYKDFKDIYDLTVKRAAREGMADVIKELQKILPDVQELARKQREKLRKGNRNETA